MCDWLLLVTHITAHKSPKSFLIISLFKITSILVLLYYIIFFSFHHTYYYLNIYTHMYNLVHCQFFSLECKKGTHVLFITITYILNNSWHISIINKWLFSKSMISPRIRLQIVNLYETLTISTFSFYRWGKFQKGEGQIS